MGIANQTTMLARESLAIAEALAAAMEEGFGRAYREENFRSFDTICSATQERQDAVKELLAEPLDAMVVIGGFNSSNTISLAMLCAERVATYHIEDADNIDVRSGQIRFRPAGLQGTEKVASGWFPMQGRVRVGVTAGASTPNNRIGETIARIFALRGILLEPPALPRD
jgi:4-hydroxy-3-methylbut-2-enyl diphosphate reductase